MGLTIWIKQHWDAEVGLTFWIKARWNSEVGFTIWMKQHWNAEVGLTFWIKERWNAEVCLCRVESVAKVLFVGAARQFVHLNEVVTHVVDHGVEGVPVAEAPPKIAHFDTVLPGNTIQQTVQVRTNVCTSISEIARRAFSAHIW